MLLNKANDIGVLMIRIVYTTKLDTLVTNCYNYFQGGIPLSRAFDDCQEMNRQLDRFKVGDYLLTYTDLEYSRLRSVCVITKITYGVATPLLNKLFVVPRIDVKYINGSEGVLAWGKYREWYNHARDGHWYLEYREKIETTDKAKIKKYLEDAIVYERAETQRKEQERIRVEAVKKSAQGQLQKNNASVANSDIEHLCTVLQQERNI